MIWKVERDLGQHTELWVGCGSFVTYEAARAHAVTLAERGTHVIRIMRVEEGKEPQRAAAFYPARQEDA